MKSLVIYFSQTGNTKTLAEAIGRGIVSKTGQCDVKSLRNVKPEDWLDYDLIGIGSCIWSSTPITNVIYHIRDLPEAVAGKHAFFFCTHGATPGRAVIRGVQPLKDKGLIVLGWRDWYAQAKVPGHGKPWFTDGHPDEIDIAEGESFGAAMAEHSKKVTNGNTGIIPELFSPEMSDLIYGIGHPFMFKAPPKPIGDSNSDSAKEAEAEPYILKYPTTMNYVSELEGIGNVEGPKGGAKTPLRINPEKCIGCMRCVEACWCDNIDGSVNPPVFRSQNCELCLFCEGVCPTGALEFDFRPPVQPGTPEYEARRSDNLMGNILAIAEASGRFRRYVNEEDIGWSTPWEVVTTHPRHKEIP